MPNLDVAIGVNAVWGQNSQIWLIVAAKMEGNRKLSSLDGTISGHRGCVEDAITQHKDEGGPLGIGE